MPRARSLQTGITQALDTEATERLFPHLSERKEAFVVEYVKNPKSQERAALAAGYSKASARTMASRLLQDPTIVRAIYDATATLLGASVPIAMANILKLSVKSKSEYVQLDASKDILTRAGMAAPKRVSVTGGLNVVFDLGE